MPATDDYSFTCPDCGTTMTVTPAMRDALVENGCVACSAPVPGSAFSVANSA